MIEHHESHHCVAGPVGSIEVVLDKPVALPVEQKSVGVVVCHPHPLHGGTMQNKVVTTLARTMAKRGHAVVRFNFRGVGNSEGSFAEGVGEQNDLRAVIHWFQQHLAFDELWLIGFSFGAYVAAALAHESQARLCVSVAPAVDRYPFAEITRGDYPWWIVQGDQDDVVDPALVYAWYELLAEPKKLLRNPDAEHYFHGQLIYLRDSLLLALDQAGL